MLNEEDEYRLNSHRDVVQEAIKWENNLEGQWTRGLSVVNQLWLANKVKELNDELKGIQAAKSEAVVVTKAKFKLMQDYKINESAAYKIIVKQSMNQRVSKLEVAKAILGE